MAIENAIRHAYDISREGSGQKKRAQALLEVLKSFKNDGFVDPKLPFTTGVEDKSQAKLFSERSRELLLKDGFEIYRLSNLSTAEIANTYERAGSYYIGLGASDGNTINGEVAFKRDDIDAPFYIDTNGAVPLKEQKVLVARYGKEVSKAIPGVKAVLGKLGDYIQLKYVCYEATGGDLFHYGLPSIDSDFTVVVMGDWEDGTDDRFSNVSSGAPGFKIIPLIVPS